MSYFLSQYHLPEAEVQPISTGTGPEGNPYALTEDKMGMSQFPKLRSFFGELGVMNPGDTHVAKRFLWIMLQPTSEAAANEHHESLIPCLHALEEKMPIEPTSGTVLTRLRHRVACGLLRPGRPEHVGQALKTFMDSYNAVRNQGSRPSATPPRATPTRPRQAAEEPDADVASSGSDLETRPSSDDVEMPSVPEYAYQQRVATPLRREHQPAANLDLERARSEFPLLSGICPPGCKLTDAAKIFFTDDMQNFVSLPAVPADIPPEEEEAMCHRYEHALTRLRTKCPAVIELMDKPPARVAWLRIMREHVLAELQYAFTELRESGWPEHWKTKRPRVEQAEEASSGDDASAQPAKGLSVAQRPFSVAPDTAERLHLHRLEIPEELGTGIAAAPESIRNDLMRALASNGLVDNQGETHSRRKHLPSRVMHMRKLLVAAVRRAIHDQSLGDTAGKLYMKQQTAEALADNAVAGKFDITEYESAARAMMGHAAPEKNTAKSLADIWVLLEAALEVSVKMIFGDMHKDALRDMRARVSVTNHSTAISVQEVKAWLQRVLESWEASLSDWRTLRGSTPMLSACLADHEVKYHQDALIAAVLAAQNFEHRNGAGKGRGKGKGRGRGSIEDSGGRGKGAARQQGASAWPGKPMMHIDKFTRFKEEVKKRFPDGCQAFLATSCRHKDKCRWSHEVPSGYAALKAEYA